MNETVILVIILLSMGSFEGNFHFMTFLIYLEFLVLTVMFYFFFVESNNLWIYLCFLIFSVCEAILGLSLMVGFNFIYGHSNINMVNLLR